MSHRIAAAVYDGLRAFEYSIAREILGRDRRELTERWYEFLPCRVESGRLFSNHGLETHPEGGLEELAAADTVLIAGWRDPSEPPGEDFLDALRCARARGARFMSICTGAFPLAYAGLLDGRVATTHWLYAEDLRREFPYVQVQADALYLRDPSNGVAVLTSAGCAAGLDLCLALVREDFGLKVANSVARRMVAPVHRDGGQAQYMEAPAGPSGEHRFGPVLDWMVEHLDAPFTLQTVARQFHFSLRTFQRRFRDATGQSPHQWLVQQRVARARELLESSDHSVEMIASLSGLGSAANLRKHFAQQLGTTPRVYRSAFRGSGKGEGRAAAQGLRTSLVAPTL